ncbi:MAG: phage holin family protein [Gammaproteobacteria bacterium]|nr:phage holin family protein [Gammaproteobacteria bacterium]
MPTASASPGKAEADAAPPLVRGLMAALLEALRTRLDLAAVELEIYLLALTRMLMLAIGALACVLLALAFGVTALVVALWDGHRMLVLVGASLLFVALAGTFGWLAARTLRLQQGVLPGSLAELHEDEKRLRSGR